MPTTSTTAQEGQSEVDEMIQMFDNLIKGGLMSRADLIEGGFTDVAHSIMTKDASTAWRGNRTSRTATRRGRGGPSGDDVDEADGVVTIEPAADIRPAGGACHRREEQ